MPRPFTWTDQQDDTIRALRGQGASWDAIAAALGISRWAASERGRAIGARFPRAVKPVIDETEAALADPARMPLAAGHPVSWALITAGTLLAGGTYPWPPMPAVRA